jgi:predicted nucleotidyltransferase
MSWRATRDIDVTLSIGLQDLSRVASLGGWRAIAEHRWSAPHDVIIDIVPADASALAGGKLRWPSGSVMSLLGFRAAFKTASETDVGGIVVGVPPVAVIVIMKMVA